MLADDPVCWSMQCQGINKVRTVEKGVTFCSVTSAHPFGFPTDTLRLSWVLSYSKSSIVLLSWGDHATSPHQVSHAAIA